jgi:prepilin-type processing-associated H-X9-DG protein
MRTRCSKFLLRARGRRDAFTLVELLVLLSAIAVLATLQVAALAKVTRQNQRAQCASNLRQFTLAMHIFANENSDKLPDNAGIGNWAWDVAFSVGTFVESTGSKWTIMYCPGTAPSIPEADNFKLYNFGGPTFRVLGYANTFANTPGVDSTNWNSTLTPQPIQIGFGRYFTPLPSNRVLLADATISAYNQNNEALRDTYNYINIVGGTPMTLLSPHLIGKIPAGGNLGMLDGHVEWRKFQDLHPRTTGISPVFWW